jgi:hypothetical protein
MLSKSDAFLKVKDLQVPKTKQEVNESNLNLSGEINLSNLLSTDGIKTFILKHAILFKTHCDHIRAMYPYY